MILKLPIILFVVVAVYASDKTARIARSLQPGAPNVNNKDQPWQLDPHIERDNKENTNTNVNIKHHGENHDFDAGWSKVVRGPNKAKPTWHVGGTYRWRRSLQPGALVISSDEENEDEEENQSWQVDPYLVRDEDGNTKADINIKRHGESHDFEAGWSKVVGGSTKAKPTWYAGGFRFRRSTNENSDEDSDKDDKPWQFDPHIGRDDDGNTRADINLKRHGENHDIEAGWSKVVEGPNRAKPTWHVGGSFRFRRSTDENGDEDSDEEDKPWQFDPHIGRDDDGNTRADINLKRHGENHDIEASWSKVVEGPNRAKPTWHVGGSFRW